MTTYILAGGNDKENIQFGAKLARTVGELISVPRPLRILSCPFATEPSIWEQKFAGRATWLRSLFPGAVVEQAVPETLIEQIKHADVVYFHGGAARILLDFMATVPDLEPYFEGKVVIGSSAGADYLSKAFYTCVDRRPMRGRGIVAKNIMPHYLSTGFDSDEAGPLDWSAAEHELREFVNGEPIVPITEGDFVVVSNP